MKIFFLLPAVLILGWTTGCKPSSSPPAQKPESPERNLETIEETNEQGELEKYTVEPSLGRKEGWYKRWSPSGQLREEAFFSEGRTDQIRILYFENGDTQIVETYQKGLFEGPYRVFYPNGKILQQGNYHINRMEGLWVKYYEEGGVKEEVTFSNNFENGPFREYYPNGALRVEGVYRNGDKEHGN
ncbi:MAG: toxin-antitoxin system YwqK family antitoxin [Haliscomenobacter sp.]|nr:toxin-antitoxin system YwqK family antitoxin [Haliscomenobacter sp.]